MSEARWGRLAADLAAVGIPARVHAHSYPGGVKRGITLRHPDGGLVVIFDQVWRKNHDVWIGWVVYREGRDSILIGRETRPSKKRSEVVAAVRQRFTSTTEQRGRS